LGADFKGRPEVVIKIVVSHLYPFFMVSSLILHNFGEQNRKNTEKKIMGIFPFRNFHILTYLYQVLQYQLPINGDENRE
jgi:hypothetical protein